MTWELLQPYFVLVLLVVVFATMVTERFRVDVVAMSGVSLLLVTGVLSTKEVLAVFSNEAPITVAAMFVLSAALERTGVVETRRHSCCRATRPARRSTAMLAHHDRRRRRLGVHEQHAGGGHPDPGRDHALATRWSISASKFLIPLSYATVLGGTCSLIGTSTNIVANGAADQQGLAPFSLFEISPVGIPLTIIGIIYLCIFALRILPDRETFSGIMARVAPAPVPDRGAGPAGLAAGRQDRRRVGRRQEAQCARDRRHPRPDLARRARWTRWCCRPGDRVVLRTNVGDVLGLRDKSDVVFGAAGQHALEPIATQNTRGHGGHRRPALALRRLPAGRPQPAPAVQRLHPGRCTARARTWAAISIRCGWPSATPSCSRARRRASSACSSRVPWCSLSEPTEQPLRRDLGWLALSAPWWP